MNTMIRHHLSQCKITWEQCIQLADDLINYNSLLVCSNDDVVHLKTCNEPLSHNQLIHAPILMVILHVWHCSLLMYCFHINEIPCNLMKHFISNFRLILFLSTIGNLRIMHWWKWIGICKSLSMSFPHLESCYLDLVLYFFIRTPHVNISLSMFLVIEKIIE